MTEHRFRMLIWFYVVMLFLASATSISTELPSSSARALGNADQLQSSRFVGFLALLGVAAFVSVCGMYFFKRWARSLAVSTTIAILPLALLAGPELYGPLESALYDLSNVLWGALLSAAYFSPVKARFGG